MENELKIFNNEKFGEIRTIQIDNEIWFVGKDVAKALGYANERDALKKHVDEEDKNSVAFHDGNKGNPNMIIINESGLYSLILSSKLPQAKEFKRWVTSEVLPSIRKNGIYMTEQKAEEIISNPDLIIQLAKEVKENRKKIQKLEIQNQNLILNNKILAKETLNWENRSILNKSIRQLALILKVDFGVMWNKFYQEMKYKHHIDLKKRGKNRFVEYIKDTEWEKALSTIVALFEENDMDFAEFVKKEFGI